MRRNALDPDAWLTEEHRFDMPGERADIRLGVHTAESFDTALAYAVHKASQEGELLDGEPNCGIIFTLDMSGLEPLPEADAHVAARDESVIVSEMFSYSAITRAVEERDVDGLAEAVQDFADRVGEDSYHDGEAHERWFEAFWREFVFEEGPWVIVNPLRRLAEEDPHDLMLVMRDAFAQRQFPLELWAEAIGQYRYMVDIGFERLLQVRAVHPVEPDLAGWEDEDEDDAEGPLVFGIDYIDAPHTELLWDSGRTARVTEYHGTDVSRARLAFPELGDTIRCPWEFGQPEGVGPA
jgi:hypothetical protein